MCCATHVIISYLLLPTSFVVGTPSPFGSAWTAIISRYDWINQRLANSALEQNSFRSPFCQKTQVGGDGVEPPETEANRFTVCTATPTG